MGKAKRRETSARSGVGNVSESAGGDSVLTRFLTRFPLLPQLAADSKTCSRITASCAKSANASAASSSVMFAAASSPDDEVEQQLDVGSNSIKKKYSNKRFWTPKKKNVLEEEEKKGRERERREGDCATPQDKRRKRKMLWGAHRLWEFDTCHANSSSTIGA